MGQILRRRTESRPDPSRRGGLVVGGRALRVDSPRLPAAGGVDAALGRIARGEVMPSIPVLWILFFAVVVGDPVMFDIAIFLAVNTDHK
jgi:hypothetical protein